MDGDGLEEFRCFERVECDREVLTEGWMSLAQNDRSRLLDSFRRIQKSADQCTAIENELKKDRAYIEDFISRKFVNESQVKEVKRYDLRLSDYANTLEILLSRRKALASLYATYKVPAVCILAANNDIDRIELRIVALATRCDATSKFLDSYYMGDLGPGTSVPSARVKGDKWKFPMNFSEGGQSQPQLWTRGDENGMILDRIVKKEEVLSAWEYEKANSKCYPKASEIDTREPMEFFTQNECWNKNKDAFVHARTWTSHRPFDTDEDDQYLVTLYLQFCPHGDLRGLIERLSAQDDQVAEPLLWRVLDTLTDACITMQRDGTLESDLKQIFHLDIKAANVFLDSPCETYFPRYPKPLLGDFGLAIHTHAQEAENPSDYRGSGTTGLKAPEMVQNVKFDDKKLRKILAHTNVYQIGLTMLELVRKKPFLPHEQLKFNTPDNARTKSC
ncbi:Putative serine/threonine-protein kinase, active [Septoria linicola]|uniref:Serine/threonine-protein kinase, active n=1 Tax=Septoria linicola TaxID=215465 RepID=A0A9Q9ANI9_9PEZI|nr:putative serine/threonine-protein kinase, active [Septoria linicola]USW49257.1 Putative serine/threonine-protein kinase, active [Septoria linicola]